MLRVLPDIREMGIGLQAAGENGAGQVAGTAGQKHERLGRNGAANEPVEFGIAGFLKDVRALVEIESLLRIASAGENTAENGSLLNQDDGRFAVALSQRPGGDQAADSAADNDVGLHRWAA